MIFIQLEFHNNQILNNHPAKLQFFPKQNKGHTMQILRVRPLSLYCRDVPWRVSTGFRTHGMCTSYFPSLNFLYPSYLSFANCSVLANNSLASAGKVFNKLL